MNAVPPNDAPLDLRRLSARLGRDPDLVQGAGGNTSVKEAGLLWIKASGKWLADAEAGGCFVPLDLARLLHGIQAGAEDPAVDALRGDLARPGLRPSVETTLHAVLPQACVLHVHSVSTIAWAVHPQGRTALAERLEGLSWRWIPYVRPGLPLTAVVSEALRRSPATVLIMANHGLVVAGESAEEAAALLQEVERRVAIAPRPFPEPDLEALAGLAAGRPYRLPQDPRCHACALDPDTRRLVAPGTLYPDHLVFLGSGARVRPAATLAANEEAPLLLIEGRGMLLHESLSPTAEAMALCLALVGQRLDPAASPLYLDPRDEAALLGWDAEAYRKSMNT